MLSRTADHLFWMARYIERAENTARILDVNVQRSLLPQPLATIEAGWRGTLEMFELMPAFEKQHASASGDAVLQFMIRDRTNPSSIVSCIYAARENARAVRGSLTTEVFETHNLTWLEIQRLLDERLPERDPVQFFDWVKFRSHLSRGVTIGTMLRDEALHFTGWGPFSNAPTIPPDCSMCASTGAELLPCLLLATTTITGPRCCALVLRLRFIVKRIPMSLRRSEWPNC